jgi:hypothetical protein
VERNIPSFLSIQERGNHQVELEVLVSITHQVDMHERKRTFPVFSIFPPVCKCLQAWSISLHKLGLHHQLPSKSLAGLTHSLPSLAEPELERGEARHENLVIGLFCEP